MEMRLGLRSSSSSQSMPQAQAPAQTLGARLSSPVRSSLPAKSPLLWPSQFFLLWVPTQVLSSGSLCCCLYLYFALLLLQISFCAPLQEMEILAGLVWKNSVYLPEWPLPHCLLTWCPWGVSSLRLFPTALIYPTFSILTWKPPSRTPGLCLESGWIERRTRKG